MLALMRFLCLQSKPCICKELHENLLSSFQNQQHQFSIFPPFSFDVLHLLCAMQSIRGCVLRLSLPWFLFSVSSRLMGETAQDSDAAAIPWSTPWEHCVAACVCVCTRVGHCGSTGALSLGWWLGDGIKRQDSWLATERPYPSLSRNL